MSEEIISFKEQVKFVSEQVGKVKFALEQIEKSSGENKIDKIIELITFLSSGKCDLLFKNNEFKVITLKKWKNLTLQ